MKVDEVPNQVKKTLKNLEAALADSTQLTGKYELMKLELSLQIEPFDRIHVEVRRKF